MAKQPVSPPVPRNDALAALGVPQPRPADDPLVMLPTGYIEDHMLPWGAVSEVVVYPPGSIIPRSEARSRHIDDAVLLADQPTSTEYVSGPTIPVRDAQLFED